MGGECYSTSDDDKREKNLEYGLFRSAFLVRWLGRWLLIGAHVIVPFNVLVLVTYSIGPLSARYKVMRLLSSVSLLERIDRCRFC